MTGSPIRIGHLSTFYHTSFILEGTDWLQEEGLDVSWKLFASGPDIVKAFDAGEVDIGYLGLPPVIIGVARGSPIKCIAGGHVEGTVMIAQPEYDGLEEAGDICRVLEQFEGMTIGTPPKGSIHDVIAHDLIDRARLKIEVRNYQWADFVLQAMIDREIPAAIGTPPLAVAAGRFGNTKIVIPPGELWPNNPSYGIIVHERSLKDERSLLTFLEQHERASALIRERPREAAHIVSDLVQTVDSDFVMDTYKVSPRYCAALPREYIDSTMRFVKVLRELNYIGRPLTEADLFERRYIDMVHPEGAHYR